MARSFAAALGAALTLGAAACQAQDACPPELLNAAAAEGELAALETCIAAGADLDAAGAHGVTPLILAAARGRDDVVEALLEAGADVDARMAGDVTALMTAAAHGQTVIVRALVRQGDADVALLDAGGRTALDWASAAPYTTGDNAVAITQFLQGPRVGATRGSDASADLPDLDVMLAEAGGGA